MRRFQFASEAQVIIVKDAKRVEIQLTYIKEKKKKAAKTNKKNGIQHSDSIRLNNKKRRPVPLYAQISTF